MSTIVVKTTVLYNMHLFVDFKKTQTKTWHNTQPKPLVLSTACFQNLLLYKLTYL